MTNDVTLVRPESVDAERVLREAVRTAQDGVLRRGSDLATVDHMLADLFADLAPVLDRLETTASSAPDGAVAAVLGYLRLAFGYAARGVPDAAVASLVTADAAAFRLADATVLDDEADVARWR